MFNKKANANDFFAELETNLNRQEKQPLAEKQAKIAAALENVVAAANLLDDAGLEKQANFATKVLAKLSWYVPTSDTSGLTPEKMQKNLSEKGWVFNADDGQLKSDVAEVNSAPISSGTPAESDNGEIVVDELPTEQPKEDKQDETTEVEDAEKAQL
jgi:hypothetical protein